MAEKIQSVEADFIVARNYLWAFAKIIDESGETREEVAGKIHEDLVPTTEMNREFVEFVRKGISLSLEKWGIDVISTHIEV